MSQEWINGELVEVADVAPVVEAAPVVVEEPVVEAPTEMVQDAAWLNTLTDEEREAARVDPKLHEVWWAWFAHYVEGR